jgi:hypothetical protein
MSTTAIESNRFYGGAPMRLESWMGLVKPDDLRVKIRAVLMIVIGWVPLVLLAAIQDRASGENSLHRLLLDFGSLARYAIAGPLFVLAESLCFPKFEKIIMHFRDSGLIAGPDLKRYDDIVGSSLRLLRSKTAEILSFVIAYAIVTSRLITPNDLISWSYARGSAWPFLSLAGKWHAFVSAPLLLVLVLGWIWRQFWWARFLWLVSRMDLQLISTHPDQCGGLNFLSMIMYAYYPIGFACTAIVAGGIANRMLHYGATLQSFREIIVAVVLFIGLFFIAPFIVFAPALRRLHVRGVFEYGSLARKIGNQLGHKWIAHHEEIRTEDLEVPDFSTTTDLYSIVSNVYKIAPVPLTFTAVWHFLVFIAIPFIPVLLMAVPVKTIFDEIVKIATS